MHNGWSCDLGIFGIPEVMFQARAFKLGMLSDLKGTCDISSNFLPNSNMYLFLEFLGISEQHI